ncbi:MAG: hypothetical protein K5979_14495 [Ruminococcus sp.]|nr:hypothetical protein [Ruminococcus sp.]
MRYTKFAAAALAAVCLFSCVSCNKGSKISVDENAASSSGKVDEYGVGELVEPAEDSEEYQLGSYRVSSSGVKLYFDDDVPEKLMVDLEEYFTSIQNSDFEAYKKTVYPDYAERFDEYLQKEYSYDLSTSFEHSHERLATIMKNEVEEHGDESVDKTAITGDFKITRIKAEHPDLSEPANDLAMVQETTAQKSLDDLEKQAFDYFTEAFGMDYYEYVKENSDDIDCVSFYIFAEGEDGEEYLIVSELNLVFALKDGKYYTFG